MEEIWNYLLSNVSCNEDMTKMRETEGEELERKSLSWLSKPEMRSSFAIYFKGTTLSYVIGALPIKFRHDRHGEGGGGKRDLHRSIA